MKTINVSDATKLQINWLVAKCEDICTEVYPKSVRAHLESLGEDDLWNTLCLCTPGAIDASVMSESEMIDYGVRNWRMPFYSTDPAQAYPIIEREHISINAWFVDGVFSHWSANGHNLKYDEVGDYVEGSDFAQDGSTQLIAAMRCHVASRLGAEVEVPDEIA